MRARSCRVILVNWKNAPLTLRAAHSIAPQMEQGDHLVIVDNGSDDDSLTVLREGLEELRGVADPARVSIVNAGTNDGFGAGVMAGAAGLSEDAVVLLNNDATVRDGFLDALLEPLGETVGATTALILLTGTWRPCTPSDTEFLVARDGSRWTRVADGESGGQVLINSTGNEVDAAGNGYDRSWLDPADSPLPAPEVFGLCGGACAIDADAWRAVGGVRTDLFMYYEDTDLSYKLREAGYEVRFVAGARGVDVDDEQVGLLVINPLANHHHDQQLSSGLGLLGIQERSRALGGTTTITPTAHQWILHTTLPLTPKDTP